MLSRLLRVTVPFVGAIVAFDPAKVCVQAVLLRRIRAAHPEMFDGALAAENVRLALLEGTANLPVPRP